MIQRFWQSNQIRCSLLAVGVISVTWVGMPVALAQFNPGQPSRPRTPAGSTGPRYVPAGPSAPRDPTGSSGTRGSCGATSTVTPTVLTALAPKSHVGKTLSTRPTFVWYVPDTQPYKVEFRLYGLDNTGRYRQQIARQELNSSAQIMQFTLPQDAAGLKVGQTYLWQVAVLCNPKDPSKDQVVTAEIEVISPPNALKANLSQTRDRLQRARLLAAAGIWYDALSELPEDNQGRSDRLALLASLAQFEGTFTTPAAKEQKTKLEQIIASYQSK